jgi:hypothetical protein
MLEVLRRGDLGVSRSRNRQKRPEEVAGDRMLEASAAPFPVSTLLRDTDAASLDARIFALQLDRLANRYRWFSRCFPVPQVLELDACLHHILTLLARRASTSSRRTADLVRDKHAKLIASVGFEGAEWTSPRLVDTRLRV